MNEHDRLYVLDTDTSRKIGVRAKLESINYAHKQKSPRSTVASPVDRGLSPSGLEGHYLALSFPHSVGSFPAGLTTL